MRSYRLGIGAACDLEQQKDDGPHLNQEHNTQELCVSLVENLVEQELRKHRKSWKRGTGGPRSEGDLKIFGVERLKERCRDLYSLSPSYGYSNR